MWTRFMDMYSGSNLKEQWQYIYIELPKDKATVYFYNRFGHNPERVSCPCCGEDYSISEHETLEQATAYERRCVYNKDNWKYEEKPVDESYRGDNYTSLADYETSKGVLIIRKELILPEMLEGEVPEQGYVWRD